MNGISIPFLTDDQIDLKKIESNIKDRDLIWFSTAEERDAKIHPNEKSESFKKRLQRTQECMRTANLYLKEKEYRDNPTNQFHKIITVLTELRDLKSKTDTQLQQIEHLFFLAGYLLKKNPELLAQAKNLEATKQLLFHDNMPKADTLGFHHKELYRSYLHDQTRTLKESTFISMILGWTYFIQIDVIESLGRLHTIFTQFQQAKLSEESLSYLKKKFLSIPSLLRKDELLWKNTVLFDMLDELLRDSRLSGFKKEIYLELWKDREKIEKDSLNLIIPEILEDKEFNGSQFLEIWDQRQKISDDRLTQSINQFLTTYKKKRAPSQNIVMLDSDKQREQHELSEFVKTQYTITKDLLKEKQDSLLHLIQWTEEEIQALDERSKKDLTEMIWDLRFEKNPLFLKSQFYPNNATALGINVDLEQEILKLKNSGEIYAYFDQNPLNTLHRFESAFSALIKMNEQSPPHPGVEALKTQLSTSFKTIYQPSTESSSITGFLRISEHIAPHVFILLEPQNTEDFYYRYCIAQEAEKKKSTCDWIVKQIAESDPSTQNPNPWNFDFSKWKDFPDICNIIKLKEIQKQWVSDSNIHLLFEKLESLGTSLKFPRADRMVPFYEIIQHELIVDFLMGEIDETYSIMQAMVAWNTLRVSFISTQNLLEFIATDSKRTQLINSFNERLTSSTVNIFINRFKTSPKNIAQTFSQIILIEQMTKSQYAKKEETVQTMSALRKKKLSEIMKSIFDNRPEGIASEISKHQFLKDLLHDEFIKDSVHLDDALLKLSIIDTVFPNDQKLKATASSNVETLFFSWMNQKPAPTSEEIQGKISQYPRLQEPLRQYFNTNTPLNLDDALSKLSIIDTVFPDDQDLNATAFSNVTTLLFSWMNQKSAPPLEEIREKISQHSRLQEPLRQYLEKKPENLNDAIFKLALTSIMLSSESELPERDQIKDRISEQILQNLPAWLDTMSIEELKEKLTATESESEIQIALKRDFTPLLVRIIDETPKNIDIALKELELLEALFPNPPEKNRIQRFIMRINDAFPYWIQSERPESITEKINNAENIQSILPIKELAIQNCIQQEDNSLEIATNKLIILDGLKYETPPAHLLQSVLDGLNDENFSEFFNTISAFPQIIQKLMDYSNDSAEQKKQLTLKRSPMIAYLMDTRIIKFIGNILKFGYNVIDAVMRPLYRMFFRKKLTDQKKPPFDFKEKMQKMQYDSDKTNLIGNKNKSTAIELLPYLSLLNKLLAQNGTDQEIQNLNNNLLNDIQTNLLPSWMQQEPIEPGLSELCAIHPKVMEFVKEYLNTNKNKTTPLEILPYLSLLNELLVHNRNDPGLISLKNNLLNNIEKKLLPSWLQQQPIEPGLSELFAAHPEIMQLATQYIDQSNNEYSPDEIKSKIALIDLLANQNHPSNYQQKKEQLNTQLNTIHKTISDLEERFEQNRNIGQKKYSIDDMKTDIHHLDLLKSLLSKDSKNNPTDLDRKLNTFYQKIIEEMMDHISIDSKRFSPMNDEELKDLLYHLLPYCMFPNRKEEKLDLSQKITRLKSLNYLLQKINKDLGPKQENLKTLQRYNEFSVTPEDTKSFLEDAICDILSNQDHIEEVRQKASSDPELREILTRDLSQSEFFDFNVSLNQFRLRDDSKFKEFMIEKPELLSQTFKEFEKSSGNTLNSLLTILLFHKVFFEYLPEARQTSFFNTYSEPYKLIRKSLDSETALKDFLELNLFFITNATDAQKDQFKRHVGEYFHNDRLHDCLFIDPIIEYIKKHQSGLDDQPIDQIIRQLSPEDGLFKILSQYSEQVEGSIEQIIKNNENTTIKEISPHHDENQLLSSHVNSLTSDNHRKKSWDPTPSSSPNKNG